MSTKKKKPKRKGYQPKKQEPIDKERIAARQKIRQQYLDDGKSPSWIENVIGKE